MPRSTNASFTYGMRIERANCARGADAALTLAIDGTPSLGAICPVGDRDAYTAELTRGVYLMLLTSNDYDKQNPPYLYVDPVVFDNLAQRNALAYPSCSFRRFADGVNSQK
jgi:hypothetical protein